MHSPKSLTLQPCNLFQLIFGVLLIKDALFILNVQVFTIFNNFMCTFGNWLLFWQTKNKIFFLLEFFFIGPTFTIEKVIFIGVNINMFKGYKLWLNNLLKYYRTQFDSYDEFYIRFEKINSFLCVFKWESCDLWS